MTCQEIAFAHGTCRLTIEESTGPTEARYVAHVTVVNEEHTSSRPLVFDDGTAVEIHGATEAAAANNAIGFCERYFGTISEQMHACVDFDRPPMADAPMLLSEAGR